MGLGFPCKARVRINGAFSPNKNIHKEREKSPPQVDVSRVKDETPSGRIINASTIASFKEMESLGSVIKGLGRDLTSRGLSTQEGALPSLCESELQLLSSLKGIKNKAIS